MWGRLSTYYFEQIIQHVIGRMEGVRRIIHRARVQAPLGCNDRGNSPGVSIGPDWADLGVKPSREQVPVAI